MNARQRLQRTVRRYSMIGISVLTGVLSVPTELEAARICTVSVFPLAFGNYTPLTPAPVDSTALIQVSCIGDPDPGQPGFYTLRISGGSSGSPSSRYMLSGSNLLSYNLYQDAALTTIWGDGTSGTTAVAQNFPGGMGMGMGMGLGLGMGMGMGVTTYDADHTVYGRSPAGQDPAPGSYIDSPLVTIEF